MSFLDRIFKAPLDMAFKKPHLAWGLVGVSSMFLKYAHINFLYQSEYGSWIKERKGELEGIEQ